MNNANDIQTPKLTRFQISSWIIFYKNWSRHLKNPESRHTISNTEKRFWW